MQTIFHIPKNVPESKIPISSSTDLSYVCLLTFTMIFPAGEGERHTFFFLKHLSDLALISFPACSVKT
jgi:hypothetical protein